jgi:hypothetical protein
LKKKKRNLAHSNVNLIFNKFLIESFIYLFICFGLIEETIHCKRKENNKLDKASTMSLNIGKKKSLPINETIPIRQMMTPS